MKYRMPFLVVVIFFVSCEKWLDVKSNKSDVTPSKLSDYETMLDNDLVINGASPFLGTVSADNYYISYATWQARTALDRNTYTWAKDLAEGGSMTDWDYAYKAIEYSNIALEGIGKITPETGSELQRNSIEGTALFSRAFAFYNLLQEFSKPFNPSTADVDPGIPLRMVSDVNVLYPRGSVKEGYEQLIKNVLRSIELLPAFSAYQTRPSRSAACGLLARVYLSMAMYDKAGEFADKALQADSTLVDFNSLIATATIPFPAYPGNREIVYFSVSQSSSILSNITGPITDSLLYQSYAANDLRKPVFYRLNTSSLPVFKGWYSGKTSTYFGGIATNELYLIRAESKARQGNIAGAMTDLNALLRKRWKAGTFTNLTANTQTAALNLILTERRKELPFTGILRWEDLRRLNRDPQTAITISRLLNGQSYVLPPNDPRYVLPIPDQEIRLGRIEQNPR